MTVWRPEQRIRVKALGLVWRAGRLLAGEVYSDDGSVKGVRPLGGTVEFGERWQDALAREFREELGAEIEILGEARVLENIYAHHGVTGHEVLFVADVRLLSFVREVGGRIEYVESDGTRVFARWFGLDELDAGVELYPTGLLEIVRARAGMAG